ncbi:putative mitochondrial 2-methylisocitrate lyase [Ilyonectria sp. MPI-CAGE-AT-0026]|nr:putative mitochondrial 2-methylisocitrate lyase [Ilyonectria sp. MPI-CAGE-AT-0026]
MSLNKVDPAEEQSWFDNEVSKITQWWQSPCQKHILRPYTAAQIASLRSSLPISYASSTQALKLWSLLHTHRQNETAELTFGMIDPILASQMEGQKTIYVSGALCAFSEAECIGQDTSDYPWDTVPKVAERIFQSQMYHDRRQRHDRMRRQESERLEMSEARDYLLPIVADADMGFGTQTATMKLVKRLVETGVAMFHLDDLALGGKRYTDGVGHTLVSTAEYLKRLGAARMQLDIMGAETLILCRCDVDGAQFITTNIDPRDHAYIMGATVPIEPLATGTKGKIETEDWKKRAKVMTFDDAVKSVATIAQFDKYLQVISSESPCSLSHRRQAAKAALDGTDVYFDWDLSRTRDGRYLFAPTVQTILERCLAAAPLGDATWARMDLDMVKLTEFHDKFRNVYPERLFAAGYSATYNFAAKGYSEEDVKTFHQKLAKLGIVWQVQPGFAMQGLNYATKKFSKMWGTEGIAGYVRDVQGPAMAVDTDGYEKMEWSGGFLVDAYGDILGDQ